MPLSAETLTARPWYLLHRTGRGQQEKVIKLEPGGVLRFLEGAETSAWDDQGGTWSYEDGHLVLTAKTGVLARFEAAQAIILRSRVEDPHRFFWMQQEISDPFLSAGGAR